MQKQDILNAYYFRHACREFDPDRNISDDDFQFILETGRLSPSSFGWEPWKFVVLQNKRIRERLIPVSWGARKHLETASHFVLMLVRTPKEMASDSEYTTDMMTEIFKLPPEGVERKRKVYQNFLDSDFKLQDNNRALFEWTCRQAYIPLGNMMTSAALIGIDSCPIEGFDKEIVESILREEGVLKGDAFELACMLAFGYRIKEGRVKTRRPVEQVVEWIE